MNLIGYEQHLYRVKIQSHADAWYINTAMASIPQTHVLGGSDPYPNHNLNHSLTKVGESLYLAVREGLYIAIRLT